MNRKLGIAGTIALCILVARIVVHIVRANEPSPVQQRRLAEGLRGLDGLPAYVGAPEVAERPAAKPEDIVLLTVAKIDRAARERDASALGVLLREDVVTRDGKHELHGRADGARWWKRTLESDDQHNHHLDPISPKLHEPVRTVVTGPGQRVLLDIVFDEHGDIVSQEVVARVRTRFDDEHQPLPPVIERFTKALVRRDAKAAGALFDERAYAIVSQLDVVEEARGREAIKAALTTMLRDVKSVAISEKRAYGDVGVFVADFDNDTYVSSEIDVANGRIINAVLTP